MSRTIFKLSYFILNKLGPCLNYLFEANKWQVSHGMQGAGAGETGMISVIVTGSVCRKGQGKQE